ncbi:MAG: serine protease [Lysobacterales bacterium]
MNSRHTLGAALALVISTAAAARAPLTSGVNDVQFASAREQAFLGSGFVIEHQGRLFGVTAKHVLLMREGGPPEHTDIQPQLEHWRLRDPRSRETLEFGRLLNGSATEAVDLEVLKRDTLVFELGSAGPFKPLHLASSAPKPGERLHAVGCSYATETSCAQDVYAGEMLERQGVNLLIDLGAQSLETMFGLSGAPVLNEAGELVGIVSNVLPDASGKPRFAPVDISYLRRIIETQATG